MIRCSIHSPKLEIRAITNKQAYSTLMSCPFVSVDMILIVINIRNNTNAHKV